MIINYTPPVPPNCDLVFFSGYVPEAGNTCDLVWSSASNYGITEHLNFSDSFSNYVNHFLAIIENINSFDSSIINSTYFLSLFENINLFDICSIPLIYPTLSFYEFLVMNSSQLTYTATGDILLWWRARTKNLLMGYGGMQYGGGNFGYGGGMATDIVSYVVQILNTITGKIVRSDTISIVDQSDPDYCYVYTNYQNKLDNGGTNTKNLTFYIQQVNYNGEYSDVTTITCS